MLQLERIRFYGPFASFSLRKWATVAFIVMAALGPSAHAETVVEDLPTPSFCERLLVTSKAKAIDFALTVMATVKGLPKYLKQMEELKKSGRYLEYSNFGEMGLAELGISVRYNQKKFEALNSGKPLIIVANHHLGIADGLALQYLASESRKNAPSLLFLARWIEKLLPMAIFGDEHNWGTAIPIEINTPHVNDPLYEMKMAQVKAFNSGWSRTSIKALKNGGALIIFPAGHVAAINEDGNEYPNNVYDSSGSWMDSVLGLARLGKADIVFAHVQSVNSKSFYTDRKRFGGGDKERVIWFFSEAVSKKNQSIDVDLSDPMSLDAIYEALSQRFGHSRAALEADSALTAELMRLYTYEVSVLFPQELDAKKLPAKRAD